MLSSKESFTGAAGLLVGVMVWKYFMKKEKDDSSSSFPLPPAGLSLTEFGQMVRDGLLVKNQMKLSKQYGTLFSVRSPFPTILPHIVVCGDVAVHKQLMLQEKKTTTKRKFSTRPKDIAWATRQGEGPSLTSMMSTSEGWKWRKTALLKEFHRKRMVESDRGLLPEIVLTSKELCRRLSKAASSTSTNNKPVAVDDITSHVVIDVVLYFLFGRRIDFDAKIFHSSAQTMLETVFECALNPLYFLLRHIPFTECYKMDRKRDSAWGSIDSVVRDEVNTIMNEVDENIHTSQRKSGAALVSLLKNEPRFRSGGIEALLADIRVFVLAGFETTSHGLSFAFFLLAMYPEVADKIAHEGETVWDKLHSEDTIQIQQALDEAPTAKFLFQEAVRLYPLVPTLPGQCLEDVLVTTSKGENYSLPKGTRLLFANIVMNRQEGGESLNTSQWDISPDKQPFMNTFNRGVHICPGKPLSLLEAHVFLIVAATKFQFVLPPSEHSNNNPSDPMDVMCRAVLTPKDGMPLLIRERNINPN